MDLRLAAHRRVVAGRIALTLKGHGFSLMRRHFLIVLLFVAITLQGLGVVIWSCCTFTVITAANADKVKVGMTLAEVEAVLGGPARSEGVCDKIMIMGPQPFRWETNELLICVWLDDEERVCRVYRNP
jgi:hypothetical protein